MPGYICPNCSRPTGGIGVSCGCGRQRRATSQRERGSILKVLKGIFKALVALSLSLVALAIAANIMAWVWVVGELTLEAAIKDPQDAALGLCGGVAPLVIVWMLYKSLKAWQWARRNPSEAGKSALSMAVCISVLAILIAICWYLPDYIPEDAETQVSDTFSISAERIVLFAKRFPKVGYFAIGLAVLAGFVYREMSM